jgi:methylenetetrahydrofolate reductase (NADPH)
MMAVSPGIRERDNLAGLLASPRYEVLPVPGVVEKVGAALPPGETVTVTASPRHGVEATIEVAERLAALGYVVVPHLAARMVPDHARLVAITERLWEARIDEAFVVGGDATPPAGPFASASELLDELARLTHAPVRIGVAGYPEGHPLIAPGELRQALRDKSRRADYVVTQICFDAVALGRWAADLRAAGIDLPIVVGLPGAVERRKLLEISLKTGVGGSLRYLAKNRGLVAGLARTRRYDPGALVEAIARESRDGDLGIAGVHLFTFNQLDSTRRWLLEARAHGGPAAGRTSAS